MSYQDVLDHYWEQRERAQKRVPAGSPKGGQWARVSDSDFESLQGTGPGDVKVGDRVWARTNGDGKSWDVEPGTVAEVGMESGDSDGYGENPDYLAVSLDSGGSDQREYWHFAKVAGGIDAPPRGTKPPAPAPAAPPRAAPKPAPARAPVPAKPAPAAVIDPEAPYPPGFKGNRVEHPVTKKRK